MMKMMNSIQKKIFIASVAGIGLLMTIIFAGSIFETNGTGTYQIKQAAMSGEMSVRNEPGMYMQSFGSITTYPISAAVILEDTKMGVRFNDGSVAQVKGTVKFRLSLDPKKQIELHRDYGSFEAVSRDLLQRNVAEALSQAATLMVAEDSYSARRAEFSDSAKQQLEKGIFKTITKTVEAIDENGTRFKKREIVVAKDEDGNPIIQKGSLLQHYGISVLQFVINDFEYDSKINELIAKKKEAEQLKVVATANAEKAKQDALTAEAQGSARIAEARANAEVQKTTEVIEAQKKAEVAKLQADQAKFEAQKIKEQGAAEAYANKLKVEAGLTPLEKAQIDKETRIGIARELAKVQFPKSMVISGGSSTGTSSTNPFDAVGLKALYDLSNQMSTAR